MSKPKRMLVNGGVVKQLKALIIIGGALLIGACSDGTVAPTAAAPSDATIQGGGSNAALTSTADTLRFSFDIDPKRDATFPIGAGNAIRFPAGSLCDPNSSYGPDQWDQPCAVARHPVTVNATEWLDANGHPRIDFDKHVRFVPAPDPRRWVIITFKDYKAAGAWGAVIEYCATETSPCIDESLTDPTLATVQDPHNGRVTRRIKHFSGYNVFAGYSDAGSTDGSMMNRMSPVVPRIGIAPRGAANMDSRPDTTQRSGYMLAWGNR